MGKVAGSLISAFIGWGAGLAVASGLFAWSRYQSNVPHGNDDNLEAFKPGDWIIGELFVAPMLLSALVAGWARRTSL